MRRTRARISSMVRLGTYSIVARDPQTGELGAAVQSHFFSVGSVVNRARAGVGAVCTQSLVEPAYAPRLLDRMQAGESPGAALAAELATDERAAYRQVAAVSAAGEAWRLAVDLRVEDHPEPLAELGRLLDVHDAYALASEGDDLMGEGRHDEAGERFRQAAALAPTNHELIFWSGLAAVHAGEM